MSAETAAADNQCPLGLWLYDGVHASARASEHYPTVKDLPATFHRAAGDVMARSLARRRGESLAAMEMGSTFKLASGKLVAALTAWSDSPG